jgi:hypothetical protein
MIIIGRNIGNETDEKVRMTEGRRRGRPPLAPGKAKRASFNTRIRSALKAELEAAADRAGRSLSEEIEFRLERSLEEQKRSGDALREGVAIGGYLTLALVLGKQDAALTQLGFPASPQMIAAEGPLREILDLAREENWGMDDLRARVFALLNSVHGFLGAVGEQAIAQRQRKR